MDIIETFARSMWYIDFLDWVEMQKTKYWSLQ